MLNLDKGNYISDNFLSQRELIEILFKLRRNRKKIGLCTGSFDILHPGHITHLEAAKKLCDVLIVGVAENEYSLNKRPNSNRPIFSQEIRAFVVSKLKSVDYVVLDNCSDEIIKIIKPEVYIKGIDYFQDPEMLSIKKALKDYGGSMAYTTASKLSTTDLIKYIKENIE